MSELLEDAYTLLKQGSYQQAKDVFRSVLEIEAQNPKALYGLGLSYIPEKQFPKAYDYLQKAYQLDPHHPVLLHDMANLARKMGKLYDAKLFYERVIEYEPRYAEAYAGLATVYEQLEHPIKAEDAYNKALSLDSDLPEVLYNLGKLLLAQGEVTRAKHQFKALLKLHPDNILARFQMGLIAYAEEDWQSASHYFSEVLQYRPQDIETLNNLGVISLKRDNPQQAIHFFGQALALEPTHQEARENIAATFMQSNRFDNAIIHYEELLQHYPDILQAQFNLACAYMTIGEFEKAKKHYKNLLKSSFEHKDILANLGLIAQQEGNLAAAQNYYERVIQVEPDNQIIRHMFDAMQQKQKTDVPPEYVAHLFDHYAYYYDKHLCESLKYHVPKAMAELCRRYQIFYEHGLDLGCGTGLSGELIKPFGRVLDGVDISQKMLDMASTKHIYAHVTCAELHEHLKTELPHYDAYFAADVFNYLGDLEAIFGLIQQQLSPGGYLLFTIESGETKTLHLNTSGRFSHDCDHVVSQLEANGFVLTAKQPIALRQQAQQPVQGYLLLATLSA